MPLLFMLPSLIMSGSSLVTIIVDIVVVICFALVAWYAIQRFSPDPVITKILGILVFLIVFIVVIADVFPGSVNIH